MSGTPPPVPIPGVDPAEGAAPAPASEPAVPATEPAVASSEPAAPVEEPRPAAQAPAAAAPKRLLVVDHHAEFARQLEGMFKRLGCAVEVRSDAVSGAAGIASFQPDAAVVDMDVPAGGGKIVYRALRTHDAARDVPVILLAAPGPRKVWQELGGSPHPRTLVLRRGLDLRLLVPILKGYLAPDS